MPGFNCLPSKQCPFPDCFSSRGSTVVTKFWLVSCTHSINKQLWIFNPKHAYKKKGNHQFFPSPSSGVLVGVLVAPAGSVLVAYFWLLGLRDITNLSTATTGAAMYSSSSFTWSERSCSVGMKWTFRQNFVLYMNTPCDTAGEKVCSVPYKWPCKANHCFDPKCRMDNIESC